MISTSLSFQNVQSFVSQINFKLIKNIQNKIVEVANPIFITLGITLLAFSYFATGIVFPLTSAVIYPIALLSSALYILKDRCDIQKSLKIIPTISPDYSILVENYQKVSKHLNRLQSLSFLAALSIYLPPILVAIVIFPPIGFTSLGIVITATIIHAIAGIQLNKTINNYKGMIQPLLNQTASNSLEGVDETLQEHSVLKRQYPRETEKQNLLYKLLLDERLSRQSKELYYSNVRDQIKASCQYVLSQDAKAFKDIEEMDYTQLKRIYNFSILFEALNPPLKLTMCPPSLYKSLLKIGSLRIDLKQLNVEQLTQLKNKLFHFDKENAIGLDSSVLRLVTELSNLASERLQTTLIKKSPTIFYQAALIYAIKNQNVKLGWEVTRSYLNYYKESLREFIKEDLFCRIR